MYSNTTFVKVKSSFFTSAFFIVVYSNTTFVKVKLAVNQAVPGATAHSNTTFVKVKLFLLIYLYYVLHKFKYNIC